MVECPICLRKLSQKVNLDPEGIRNRYRDIERAIKATRTHEDNIGGAGSDDVNGIKEQETRLWEADLFWLDDRILQLTSF